MGRRGGGVGHSLPNISFDCLIAPEVMCRQPHTFAVDYFALGVLAYEFMLGRVSNLRKIASRFADNIRRSISALT